MAISFFVQFDSLPKNDNADAVVMHWFMKKTIIIIITEGLWCALLTLSNDFKKYYRSFPLAQYLKPDIARLKTRERERERERDREREKYHNLHQS